MSLSLLVSSLVCQDTLFLSLIYFFDQKLVCSFSGDGSGLDFFGLVLSTSTATPECSREGDHAHVPWPMNVVHFATETYRAGFQKKDKGEYGDSRRKSYLFPKIFVTNLQFDQVRFFFNCHRGFHFFCCFVATQPSIRNAHKWWFEGKPGSARLEDTPAMDLELKGIHTHTHVDRQKRYRTKYTSINTQHGFTSHTQDNN